MISFFVNVFLHRGYQQFYAKVDNRRKVTLSPDEMGVSGKSCRVGNLLPTRSHASYSTTSIVPAGLARFSMNSRSELRY
jgi:hypothetical protein